MVKIPRRKASFGCIKRVFHLPSARFEANLEAGRITPVPPSGSARPEAGLLLLAVLQLPWASADNSAGARPRFWVCSNVLSGAADFLSLSLSSGFLQTPLFFSVNVDQAAAAAKQKLAPLPSIENGAFWGQSLPFPRFRTRCQDVLIIARCRPHAVLAAAGPCRYKA